jgi:hypothetical protein
MCLNFMYSLISNLATFLSSGIPLYNLWICKKGQKNSRTHMTLSSQFTHYWGEGTFFPCWLAGCQPATLPMVPQLRQENPVTSPTMGELLAGVEGFLESAHTEPHTVPLHDILPHLPDEKFHLFSTESRTDYIRLRCKICVTYISKIIRKQF